MQTASIESATPINTRLIDPKTMQWSYSRLSTYERCQRLFFYKYIMGRPTPVTVPLLVGGILHDAIEWCVKEGYTTSEAIRFALYKYDGLPASETFQSLLRMLESALFHVPIDDNVQSEVHLKVKTRLGVVQGYLDIVIDDVINDTVEIIDFKSSWVEGDAQESKQLMLYAWLFTEMRGSAFSGDITAKLIYPRINKVNEVQFTKENLQAIKQWFVETVEEIIEKPLVKDEWSLPCDKSVCEHCPFAGLCAGEFTGKFPNSGEFANTDEAKAAGEFILQQEIFIKKLKKSMRAYIEAGNTVEIGDMEWYIDSSTPKPKVTDNREWINQIEDLGLDVADYITAESTKIEEILDADEEGKVEQLIEWTSPRKTLKYGKMQKEEA